MHGIPSTRSEFIAYFFFSILAKKIPIKKKMIEIFFGKIESGYSTEYLREKFPVHKPLDSPGTVHHHFACAQLSNLLDFFFFSVNKNFFFLLVTKFFFCYTSFRTNLSYNTNIGSRLVGSTFFFSSNRTAIE